MTQRFYSHGKLLLTGEYVVLDGALSLAVPTKKGQTLEVTPINEPLIKWHSLLENKSLWLETSMPLPLARNKASQDPLIKRLLQILLEAQRLNPEILKTGVSFKSALEFNKSWGLGSSSTLITNIAQWAQIDPYELLNNTFGGSGYDIACAQATGPISYQLLAHKPTSSAVAFNPDFKEELFFVYLNRKQNSRDSIQHYRTTAIHHIQTAVAEISKISTKLIQTTTITAFEKLVEDHEQIISSLIKTPTLKAQLFSDYPRTIKSLGGWGGDFILATGGDREKIYFRDKGYTTILSYTDMVL